MGHHSTLPPAIQALVDFLLALVRGEEDNPAILDEEKGESLAKAFFHILRSKMISLTQAADLFCRLKTEVQDFILQDLENVLRLDLGVKDRNRFLERVMSHARNFSSTCLSLVTRGNGLGLFLKVHGKKGLVDPDLAWMRDELHADNYWRAEVSRLVKSKSFRRAWDTIKTARLGILLDKEDVSAGVAVALTVFGGEIRLKKASDSCLKSLITSLHHGMVEEGLLSKITGKDLVITGWDVHPDESGDRHFNVHSKRPGIEFAELFRVEGNAFSEEGLELLKREINPEHRGGLLVQKTGAQALSIAEHFGRRKKRKARAN